MTKIKNLNPVAKEINIIMIVSLFIMIAAIFITIGVTGTKWYVGVYIVLIGAGILRMIHSCLIRTESDYVGPGESNVRLVHGIILMMLGITGLISVYVTSNIWVIVGLIILTLAVAALAVTFKSLMEKIKKEQ